MNKNEILSAEDIPFDVSVPQGQSELSDVEEKEAIGAYPEEVGEFLPEDIGEELEIALPEEEAEGGGEEERRRVEKEEYRRLIKTRFKEFYSEDTQKLINRRFKRYKELEERHSETERQLAEANRQLDALRASLDTALETVAKETEERVLNSIRLRHMRPDENGIARKQNYGKSQVSALTKSERANIAKRAADGEKIVF